MIMQTIESIGGKRLFPRGEFIERWDVTIRSYVHKSLKAALQCSSGIQQLNSSLNFQWSMLLCNWLLWPCEATARYVTREELWPGCPVPSWLMQMVLKPPLELQQAQLRCSPGVQGKACSLCCLCFLNVGRERRESPNNESAHKNGSHYKVSWLVVLILFWLCVFSWISISKVMFKLHTDWTVCTNDFCAR